LQLKLGVRVPPRTVRKYLPRRPPGRPRGDQRWSTFLKNHAKSILACDFFVAVTATFRLLYVFVVIEHGSRRLRHVNVTAHPSAAWTLQQQVVTDPSPAMVVTMESPGATTTIGPSAPLITTSPSRRGLPTSTILRASQSVAWSGCPRQAAPTPSETTLAPALHHHAAQPQVDLVELARLGA